MNKTPALTGWTWVKQGFAIFRKQPAQFMMMFLGYMFIMFLLGIIPIIGQAMPLVFAPAFSMLFMIACDQVERHGYFESAVLKANLGSPRFRKLFYLGGLYLVAGALAIAASSLVDGGVFLKTMAGQVEATPDMMRESNMMVTLMVTGLIYAPAAMAFWFAAPLIVWQDMPIFKAIFYSFFAVFHAGRAFLVYAISWIVLGVLVPSMLSILLALVIGRGMAVMIFMFIASIMLTVVMYCSFYPTYVHVFGRPDESAPEQQ